MRSTDGVFMGVGAAASPSFIREGWWRRDCWKSCALEWRRKRQPSQGTSPCRGSGEDALPYGEKMTLEQISCGLSAACAQVSRSFPGWDRN